MTATRRSLLAMTGAGLTLAAIGRVLAGDLGPVDADLATAVAAARGGDGAPATLSIEELAAASGVPASLIEAVEREGIAIGRRPVLASLRAAGVGPFGPDVLVS